MAPQTANGLRSEPAVRVKAVQSLPCCSKSTVNLTLLLIRPSIAIGCSIGPSGRFSVTERAADYIALDTLRFVSSSYSNSTVMIIF